MKNVREMNKLHPPHLRPRRSFSNNMAMAPQKSPENHTATCASVRERLGFTLPSSSDASQDDVHENKCQKLIIPRWKTSIQIQQDIRKQIPNIATTGLIFQQNITTQRILQSEHKPLPRSTPFIFLKNTKQSSQPTKELSIANYGKQDETSDMQTLEETKTLQTVDRLIGKVLKRAQNSPFKKSRISVTQKIISIDGNKKAIISENTNIDPSTLKTNKGNTNTQGTNTSKKNVISEKPLKKTSPKQRNQATPKTDTLVTNGKRLKTLAVSKSTQKPEIPKLTKLSLPPDSAQSMEKGGSIVAKLNGSKLDDVSLNTENLPSSISFCGHDIKIYPSEEPDRPSCTDISVQTADLKPGTQSTIKQQSNWCRSAPCDQKVSMLPSHREAKAKNEKLFDLKPSKNSESSRFTSHSSNNVNNTNNSLRVIVPTKYKSDGENFKTQKKSNNASQKRSSNSKTSKENSHFMKTKATNKATAKTKTRSIPIIRQDSPENHSKASEKNLNGRKQSQNKQSKSETKKVVSSSLTSRNIHGSPLRTCNSKILKPVVKKHSSISFRSSKRKPKQTKAVKSTNSITPIQSSVETQTTGVILTHNHNLPLCCLIWGHEDSSRRRVVPRTALRSVKTCNKKPHQSLKKKRNSISSFILKRMKNVPRISCRSLFNRRPSRLLTRTSSSSLGKGGTPVSQTRVFIRGQDPPYVIRRQFVSDSHSSLQSDVGSCSTFNYPYHGTTWETPGNWTKRMRSTSLTNQTSTIQLKGRNFDVGKISSQPNASVDKPHISPSTSSQSLSHFIPSPAPRKVVPISSSKMVWAPWTTRSNFSHSPPHIPTVTRTTVNASTSAGPSRDGVKGKESKDAATEPISSIDILKIENVKSLIRDFIYSHDLFSRPLQSSNDMSTVMTKVSAAMSKKSLSNVNTEVVSGGKPPSTNDAVCTKLSTPTTNSTTTSTIANIPSPVNSTSITIINAQSNITNTPSTCIDTIKDSNTITNVITESPSNIKNTRSKIIKTNTSVSMKKTSSTPIKTSSVLTHTLSTCKKSLTITANVPNSTGSRSASISKNSSMIKSSGGINKVSMKINKKRKGTTKIHVSKSLPPMVPFTPPKIITTDKTPIKDRPETSPEVEMGRSYSCVDTAPCSSGKSLLDRVEGTTDMRNLFKITQ